LENKSKLKPTSAIVTSISGKERSRSKSGEKKLKVSNTSAAGNNKVSVKTPIVTKKSCVSNNNVINIEKIKQTKDLNNFELKFLFLNPAMIFKNQF